jgi:uncharacterized protein (TIGR00255 family)
MVRSMTGYGRADAEFGGARVEAEVRSVNHRYCEVGIRLPKFLAALEPQVRALVQERVSRGKVSLSVSWDGDGSTLGQLRLNEELAERYMRLFAELKARFALKGEVDLSLFVGLPDLLRWETPEVDEAEAWKFVRGLVGSAVDDLNEMKRCEGGALQVDLTQRIGLVDASLGRVRERASLQVATARERLRQRVNQLLEPGEIDPARLEQEVTLLADRIDITEECVRLDSHNRQFLALLAGPELAGRKLNFILQEMNREANTMGSKAADVEIVSEVIAIKEEIEKIREQVQNVE